MKRKLSERPITKTKKPEPEKSDPDWVIWAAWADRITFEDIKEQTGLTEPEVIAIMRRNLKASSFKRWRKRASQQSLKHRKRFILGRQLLRKPSFADITDEPYTDED